jgi:hypothetical protein
MSELDVERLRDMAGLREAARREAEDNARHPRRSFRIETELATYRAAVDALTPDDWQALVRLTESRPSDGLAAAAEEYLVAVGAYLDPSNQFTDSRRHHVEVAEAALRAALASNPMSNNASGERDAAAWGEALADPEFRAALDEGLADVQAGRVSQWSPAAEGDSAEPSA